jgi:hypothetical protein
MAVFDRGKFERLQYGVPTDEWLSLTQPIIALHPYGDTVLLYASDPAVRAKATEATLAYRPDVLEHAMLPFFDRTIPFDDKRRATLSRVAARFVDDTAGELARFLRYTSADDESFDYWWSRLREVSPHSPMIQLTSISRGIKPRPGYELARLAGDATAMRRALEVAPAVATHPSNQLLFLLNDQPPPTGAALKKQLDGVIAAATTGDGPGVGGPRPELVALATALAEVGLEPAGRIDAAPLRALATKLDSRKRCTLHYLLGLVLEREGRGDEAVAEWTECLKLADVNYSMRTLAGARLVAHGVSADDFPPLEPMTGE